MLDNEKWVRADTPGGDWPSDLRFSQATLLKIVHDRHDDGFVRADMFCDVRLRATRIGRDQRHCGECAGAQAIGLERDNDAGAKQIAQQTHAGADALAQQSGLNTRIRAICL